MEEKFISETHKEEVCCCSSEEHEHHHEHEHEGHEHHHEHGHEHHHGHEHEGYEHQHEHEHHHHHDHEDHECCGHDHDHDHHHDHGHQHNVPGFRIFETHSHEGATICSFEKDVNGGAEAVVKQMENCINALEKWLDETGAAIGHVKGYVKESGPVTTFSTVGCGLNVEKHDGASLAIGFAAIVFGPEEEELKAKVEDIFAGLGK